MLVSETLDVWLKVQRSWMYLQPIFDSEDIMKQLPAEGKRFKQVDSQWRRAMHNAHLNPKVIDICADEQLKESWISANVMLEAVQKGLEDYLEMKRSLFARFYFLSNDELLEILSQTKDPTRVQPFLCKVFEAIGTVDFTENLEITAMKSTDGEKVLFRAAIGSVPFLSYRRRAPVGLQPGTVRSVHCSVLVVWFKACSRLASISCARSSLSSRWRPRKSPWNNG